MTKIFWSLAFFVAYLHSSYAQNSPVAFSLTGTKTLYAHPQNQEKISIGKVIFRSTGDASKVSFEPQMNHEVFKDFFLSMKEFKCLESAREVLCHVPYPYKHAGTISLGATPAADDFAWLEHQLLFMFKLPSEFGAKLWNGLYYKLERSGAGGLTGRAQAVDLNRISAPPDNPAPPYRPALRDDIPEGSRWMQRISVE